MCRRCGNTSGPSPKRLGFGPIERSAWVAPGTEFGPRGFMGLELATLHPTEVGQNPNVRLSQEPAAPG